MSYKLTVESKDIDRQIKLLSMSDKFLDDQFADGMKHAVDVIYREIKPNIPNKTGQAEKEFRKGVFGYGRTLTGAVGWFGQVDAWYINIVEHGARKHSLKPVKGSSQKGRARREEKLDRQLARGKGPVGSHFMIDGKWVTKAVHTGFSPRGFMAAGLAAVLPRVNAEMKKAADQALEKMTVKP